VNRAAPQDEALAGRLRLLRKTIGLSQEQLARQLNVSFATVNRWESGHSRASARTLTALAEHYPPLDWRQAADAQAIVILGGDGRRPFAPEYGGPAAELSLLERLSYGAYIAHRIGLPILVTGYHVEATAMHDTLLRNFGIEARWVDDQAYDTFENARNSVRILKADGIHRIVLVTSATHLWRAVQEFVAAGVEVVPAPVGMLVARDIGISRYLPNTDALQRAQGAVYELIGEPVRVFLAATGLRRH